MDTPKKKRFSPYLYDFHIDWANSQLEDASTYLRQLIEQDIERKKGKKYLDEVKKGTQKITSDSTQ